MTLFKVHYEIGPGNHAIGYAICDTKLKAIELTEPKWDDGDVRSYSKLTITELCDETQIKKE